MLPDIEIEWKRIRSERDPRWKRSRVLYAFTDPDDGEILYIGKADYRTVRERFNCIAKDGIWIHLEKLGIDELDVLVGAFLTEHRLTSQLLEDTESLLINRLLPCCNIRCTKSRARRPGLHVLCTGIWPHKRCRFIDR